MFGMLCMDLVECLLSLLKFNWKSLSPIRLITITTKYGDYATNYATMLSLIKIGNSYYQIELEPTFGVYVGLVSSQSLQKKTGFDMVVFMFSRNELIAVIVWWKWKNLFDSAQETFFVVTFGRCDKYSLIVQSIRYVVIIEKSLNRCNLGQMTTAKATGYGPLHV